MNVLLLAPGYDVAGVGHAIKRAFDAHAPGWTARQACRRTKAFAFPVDVQADWRSTTVRQLVAEADVVHLMDRPLDLSGKRLVMHHHGSYFRSNAERLLDWQRRAGAVGLASTIDLVLMGAGELQWLPAPVDVPALSRVRLEEHWRDGTLRVAHAPSARAGKSTDAFLAAMELVKREVDVEVDVIEGVPWDECLRRKARADVYFDQVLTGYGNNAVEAWAMGIPVIAGVDVERAHAKGYPVPENTLDEMRRLWGHLPFLDATEDTIADAVLQLVDRNQQLKYSQLGWWHVLNYHAAEAVVQRLIDVYRRQAGVPS